MSLLYCLVCSLQPCDHLLGKADLLAIFLCFVTVPYGVSGKVWQLIVSIPDLCLLLYTFNHLYFKRVLWMTSIDVGAYKRVFTSTKN